MFKQIAWSIVKPLLMQWLKNRALVLPALQVDEIAKKTGIPSGTVVVIDQYIIDYTLQELDKFKP